MLAFSLFLHNSSGSSNTTHSDGIIIIKNGIYLGFLDSNALLKILNIVPASYNITVQLIINLFYIEVLTYFYDHIKIAQT